MRTTLCVSRSVPWPTVMHWIKGECGMSCSICGSLSWLHMQCDQLPLVPAAATPFPPGWMKRQTVSQNKPFLQEVAFPGSLTQIMSSWPQTNSYWFIGQIMLRVWVQRKREITFYSKSRTTFCKMRNVNSTMQNKLLIFL